MSRPWAAFLSYDLHQACPNLALFGHAVISAIRLLLGGKRTSPWLARHARSRPGAHQRGVAMRRPDEEGPCACEVREHHEAALGAIVKAHIKEAAN